MYYFFHLFLSCITILFVFVWVCMCEGLSKCFVSHHYLDLDFPPKAAWKTFIFFCVCISVCVYCLFVCVRACQERKVRQWSWRTWSFISASVCRASRTTAPSLSSPPTARASSCPTASTPQWVGHTNKRPSVTHTTHKHQEHTPHSTHIKV